MGCSASRPQPAHGVPDQLGVVSLPDAEYLHEERLAAYRNPALTDLAGTKDRLSRRMVYRYRKVHNIPHRFVTLEVILWTAQEENGDA